MSLITPGYWPRNYWPKNYWPDVTSVYIVETIKLISAFVLEERLKSSFLFEHQAASLLVRRVLLTSELGLEKKYGR